MIDLSRYGISDKVLKDMVSATEADHMICKWCGDEDHTIMIKVKRVFPTRRGPHTYVHPRWYSPKGWVAYGRKLFCSQACMGDHLACERVVKVEASKVREKLRAASKTYLAKSQKGK